MGQLLREFIGGRGATRDQTTEGDRVSPVDGRPRMIFVLGTGRCGSTLVEEILCRHPSVGFVSNLEDRYPLPPAASRWNGRLYRGLPARATQKGRLRYAPSEAYRCLLYTSRCV